MERTPSTPPHPFRRPTLLVAATVVVCGLAVAAWVLFGDRGPDGNAAAAVSTLKLDEIPFDGTRAYEYLKQLCAIGPRRSGSAGMKTQQKLLAEHFQKLGGQVEFQRFRARDPQDGSWVPMANLVVRWHPKSTQRILLCAHYDTLPFPLRDPVNRRGRFVGANDNASGVAVLMELGRDMPKLAGKYGVDFALLDAEEYIFDEQDPMYLGAEFFARQYAKEQAQRRPAYRYRWGVLLDMIGAAALRIPVETNSASWRDTRPLINEIWATAARLGVREFVAGKKERSRGRPHHPAQRRPHPLHRRDRRACRLPPLAHPRRHARQVLAAEPGQGRLGDARMAEDGEMRNDEAGMTKDERSSKLEIRSPNSDFGLRTSDFLRPSSFEIRHLPMTSEL